MFSPDGTVISASAAPHCGVAMISEGFSVTAFKIECVIRRKDVTPADVTDSARSQVSRVVMLIARLEIFRSSQSLRHVFRSLFPE